MINKDTYKRLTRVHIAKDGDGSGFETGTKWVEKLSQDGDILHRLAELEDKIENGTLFELPCKAGDIVYRIWTYSNGGYVQDYTIVEIEIYEDEILLFDDSDNQIQITDIGKTVFLTKDQAEARLKELKGE